MNRPDLNQLYVLEALLTEGGVAAAARRLQLSPSAMSRALARLRDATGDPLLVRAGGALVPTPRALELRDLIGPLTAQAAAALRPTDDLRLDRLDRLFTLRVGDGFVENFGPTLIEQVSGAAPGVRLRFMRKPDRDSAGLRDGSVDLETGVIGPTTSPEIRAQALFRDRFVGAVRPGHPLTRGDITAERYAAVGHVCVVRRNQAWGIVDDALAALGLRRRIVATVDGFAAALALVRGSDLATATPERHANRLRDGLFSFELPFFLPEITVSMLWHPRNDADPAHRWLRTQVRAACGVDAAPPHPTEDG